MSIFDRESGFNPNPWLNEKTLLALQATAAIVDLANEPDTAPWYAKRLRQLAMPILARLVPIVALLYDAGQDAASLRNADAIAREGSNALDAWRGEHGIRNPIEAAFSLDDAGEDETEDKNAAAPERLAAVTEDPAAVNDLRLDVYASMARTLLHAPPSPSASRLLFWLLAELRLSPYGDIARVPKKFLPTDTGLTPEETAAAYHELYDRGLVERVDLPTRGDDGLALRLVVSGRNESKHPLPYREETFGYTGARIAGKQTMGNLFILEAPGSAEDVGRRLRSADDLRVLRELFQHGLGVDRAYVELVERHSDGRSVVLRVRFPLDEDETDIKRVLVQILERFVRSGGDVS